MNQQVLGVVLVSISIVSCAVERSLIKLSPKVTRAIAAQDISQHMKEQKTPVPQFIKRRMEQHAQKTIQELSTFEKQELALFQAQVVCKDYAKERNDGRVLSQKTIENMNQTLAAACWAPLMQSQRRTKQGAVVPFVAPQKGDAVMLFTECVDG